MVYCLRLDLAIVACVGGCDLVAFVCLFVALVGCVVTDCLFVCFDYGCLLCF